MIFYYFYLDFFTTLRAVLASLPLHCSCPCPSTSPLHCPCLCPCNLPLHCPCPCTCPWKWIQFLRLFSGRREPPLLVIISSESV